MCWRKQAPGLPFSAARKRCQLQPSTSSAFAVLSRHRLIKTQSSFSRFYHDLDSYFENVTVLQITNNAPSNLNANDADTSSLR